MDSKTINAMFFAIFTIIPIAFIVHDLYTKLVLIAAIAILTYIFWMR